MACREVAEGVLCQRAGGDGVAWWDQGGGVVWQIPVGNLSEVGTTAAAFIALYLAFRAGVAAHRATEASLKLLALEQEREAGRKEAEERAEADRVAAWLPDKQRPGYVTVRVSNGTSVPIYDVQVQIVRTSDNLVLHRHEVGLCAPGGRDIEINLGDPLAPNVGLATTIAFDRNRLLPSKRAAFAAAVRFRDAAGRTWERSHVGVLSKKSDHFIH